MANPRRHNRTRSHTPLQPDLCSASDTSDISQTLDTVLLKQALSRRRNPIFVAVSALRSRPSLNFEENERISQVKLLNTICDLHLPLLQQKAQLDDLRCQVAKVHGSLGKLQHTLQTHSEHIAGSGHNDNVEVQSHLTIQ